MPYYYYARRRRSTDFYWRRNTILNARLISDISAVRSTPPIRLHNVQLKFHIHLMFLTYDLYVQCISGVRIDAEIKLVNYVFPRAHSSHLYFLIY